MRKREELGQGGGRVEKRQDNKRLDEEETGKRESRAENRQDL
jgi:hypothetical protein